jgi:SAM-dependent methyltransferase
LSNESFDRLPEYEFREIYSTRRHPRPVQFDYLHARYLLSHLSSTLRQLPHPIQDVLDIYCGTRPYEDLLPPGARYVGLDIEGNPYGAADVITDDFLPFDSESFDLVLCTEAFHYVPDPTQGIEEIRRVLRPGGSVILSVPLVWEYDRSILEHRYTGPELATLFDEWDDVNLLENGGLAVSWATLTGWIVRLGELNLRRRLRIWRPLQPPFAVAYLAINTIGMLLDWIEGHFHRDPYTLPMNLVLSARRPIHDSPIRHSNHPHSE